MGNIRRVVETPYASCAEWEHPEELSRDWDAYFNTLIKEWHWEDFIYDGDLVIDIGAHTGDTSLVMGYLSRNVVAYEPNPDVFPVLAYNAQINPTLNICPYNIAITEKTDTYPLYDHSGQHCNMGIPERGQHPTFMVQGFSLVDALTLHGELFEDVTFIKIDTEGYDIQIFNSIAPQLEASHPVIFMEWHADVDEDFFLSSIVTGYVPLNPYTLSPVDAKTEDVLCLKI